VKGCDFSNLLGHPAAESSCAALATRQDDAVSIAPRREVLRLLAAALAAAIGWPREMAAAALPLDRDQFVKLSEKLCAMRLDGGSLADEIQSALAERYSGEDFRRIALALQSGTPQEIERVVAELGVRDLAKSIVSVWYSGMLGTGEGARVLAYEDALAWRATGYAKAPGTCGEFGDWTTKPPDVLNRERRP
jgi:hypothetical protein